MALHPAPYAARWLKHGSKRHSPLIARLAILLVVLLKLTPAPPRLVPYPPQTVVTHHPIVCVHTRLTDEVEDIKIQRSVQLVREMGASTIVEFLPWAYVEHADGYFDWSHPDRIINMAHHEGLHIIARLGLVPDWARPNPSVQQTTLNYLEPKQFAKFARFAAKFAERYRGKVDALIVLNEPNINMEWGYRQSTPQEYVDLLKLVYPEVHAANPDMRVLAGALAPTNEPDGSPYALNELIYLRRMYEAGAKDYFDGLAVHAYGLTEPADEAPAPDRLNFRRFELQLAIMKEFGDGEKPIYITESGWNDHPRWTKAVKPGQRIEYTLDSFKMLERDWPTVKNLCIWYFRVPVPVLSYPDNYAFVTTEFRPRPIYNAVQGYALDTGDR